MAWAHARPATTSLRWSCKRCYTVNAIGAQFCSDCGLAPVGGTAAAVSLASGPTRRRHIAVPIAFGAVAALALVGMQLIR